MEESDQGPLIQVDNPISKASEDRLGRKATVDAFVRQILEIDTRQGLTVGVFGPWGSGKTSFIHLAKAEFEGKGIPVIEFNPWMFSGTEQLVARLFAELASNLGDRNDNALKKTARLIAGYGHVLVGAAHLVTLATAVPGVSKLLKPVVALAQRIAAPIGLSQARKELEDVLSERETPIVVVLDDVDRLTIEEIRQLFKLLRLTASFPYLVYVVLCDRERVEQALEDGVAERGRQYLEKIIQLQFDLPAPPKHLLRAQLQQALDDCLPAPSPITEDIWPEIQSDIVAPLIGNLRDVRRYVMTVRGTALALDGEVEISDILGLEAIRLFLPDVFKHLHDCVDVITFPTYSSVDERDMQRLRRGLLGTDPVLKARLKRLVDAGRNRPHVVEAMLKYLFSVRAAVPPGARAIKVGPRSWPAGRAP